MKQSIPSTETTPNVVTGSVRSPRSKSRKTLGTALLMLAVVVLTVVIVVGLTRWQDTRKAYISAGDFTISHKQYDQLKQQAAADKTLKQSFIDAATTIVKRRAAADSLHLKPSQHEIDEAAKILFAKNNGLNDWQQLRAYDSSLDTAAADAAPGSMEGAIFVFPFSSQPSTYVAGKKLSATDQSQEDTYSQSIYYAQVKANYYHDALVNKKMNDAGAIKDIQADKKLGGSTNPSITVTAKSTDWETTGLYKNLAANIILSGKKGYGPVMLGQKASQSLAKQQPVTEDTYFYFYHIASTQKGRLAITLQFVTAQAKQAVKVSVPSNDR